MLGNVENPKQEVKPQPGFQEHAIDCAADIAIIGGSAGCGKTFCLLFEPLKYSIVGIPNFNGIIFRRNLTEIRTTGGLWDKAKQLYSLLPNGNRPEWFGGNTSFKFKFPGGFDLQLAHLHEEDTVYQYQGTEICYIAFDELTHFTEEQFFYMLSRNRSTCGVEPYVRASTNPQGDGWVKRLISWWLYPDDYHIEALRGAPIPERQGKILYFARISNQIIMRETRSEVARIVKEMVSLNFPDQSIRSITFVAGKIYDNDILMKTNPGYIGNLLGLDDSERAQLLDGRWIEIDDESLHLYSRQAVLDIFTNFVAKGTTRYITADIAFEGVDKFVIAIWAGWVLVELRVFDKSLGDEVLNEIKKAAQDYKVPFRNIAYDATGVGTAYKGFLRSSIAVVANSAPIIAQKRRFQKVKTPSEYFNLRSQLYFELKDIIDNCEILVEDIRYKTEIEQELRAIKKVDSLQNAGKLKIISNQMIKQVLKRSPDFATVISMRKIFDLISLTSVQAPKRTARTY